MSKYVSVKGWIECDSTQIEGIRKIILNYESRADFGNIIDCKTIEFYNKGWCYPNENINWTAYIFYGADVKEYCLDFIKEEIKEILTVNTEIEGKFFFDYEEGEVKCWEIVDSQIVEKN